MNHSHAFFEKLASSSLRVSKSLMVLCAIVLLLVGISYWGVQRMLDEQYDTVRFHFTRLMENIREQESFLNTLSRQSAQGDLLDSQSPRLLMQKPLPNEGADIYEALESSYSLPFSVKISPTRIAASQRAKVFAIGAHLANYYSAFWSASHYQSPQVLLFNVPDNFDISVPSAGRLRGAGQIQGGEFVGVVKQVLKRLHDKNPKPVDGQVHWDKYSDAFDNTTPPTILAYVNIDMPVLLYPFADIVASVSGQQHRAHHAVVDLRPFQPDCALRCAVSRLHQA